MCYFVMSLFTSSGAGTSLRGATDLIHTVRRMTSTNPM